MTTTDAHQTPEYRVARFITDFPLSQVPADVIEMAVQVLRTVAGTTVAGATQDGVPELHQLLVSRGGAAEATALVYGEGLPATSAAMLNATMARALDYCDTMVPGLHLGSSVIPAALAAAESRGGCTGEEFLAGVVVGLETGAHLNLAEDQYAGFDPTGVAGVYGAAAAAARILGLGTTQTLNALALAFNRGTGTFQANADASLGVRFIQGFTASAALECVQLARVGITGPHNFLTGTFGYLRMYGRGQGSAEQLVDGLGERWEVMGNFFKKFPCCGLTQGPTESTLVLMEEHGFGVDDVARVDLALPAFAFNLIGHPFSAGANPRVNAQFSAQYCIANALVHGSALLSHFEPASVVNLQGHPVLARVHVTHDPSITGHSASRLTISTVAGDAWTRSLDIGPGYPGNPLTPEEHQHSFEDCMGYAAHPLGADGVRTLETAFADISAIADIRLVVEALISPSAGRA